MPKCPVCGNRTSKITCPSCGFDASRDYEGSPTLSMLPARLPSRKGLAQKYLARTSQGGSGTTVINTDTAGNNHKTDTKSGGRWIPAGIAGAVVLTVGVLFLTLFSGKKDPCANGRHQMTTATCTAPKTCSVCGETEGSVLAHTMSAATCTAPKTCSECGKTEGNALGHRMVAATCTAPKTCSVCGKTEGSVLAHTMSAATCTAPKTCSECGKTEGSALDHDWLPATTSAPETCDHCGETRGNKLSAANEFSSYNIGDKFYFGSYEQDGSRGNGSEPIQWEVLDKEDGRILVVAYRALDCRQYHSTKADVTWETCDLRQWLNSDFYEEAFTEDERKMILLSTVTADPHPTYDTNPGKDTQDYVFLLSVSEVKEYFGYYEKRRCWATDYAKSRGAQSSGAPIYCTWWLLRTPNDTANHVAVVSFNSHFGGARVESEYGAVRPAIWISTNS